MEQSTRTLVKKAGGMYELVRYRVIEEEIVGFVVMPKGAKPDKREFDSIEQVKDILKDMKGDMYLIED